MSSSPRRSTPDASFGDDPLASDQMQDIAISGDVAAAAGDPASQVEQSGAFVVDKSALRRYNGWLALAVASSIGYAALVTENGSNETGRGLSFAVLGLSLVVSLCVSGCFLAPDCNACTKAFLSPTSSVGRLLELGLTLIMFIMWCIGLPVIMNPSHFIAVSATQVVNANLYIATWACFGCVVFLLGDLMGDFFAGPHGTALGLTRLDPETGEYTTTAPFTMIEYKRLWETRRGKWFALAVITGVALSTSVRIFQAFGCKADEMRTNNLCIDSKVAISMTTLGGILSLAMIGIGSLGGGSIENIEKIGAVTTTGVWSICLGFITFGEGPGTALGNLFFSTWGGFILSVMILADCFRGSVELAAQGAVTSEIELQDDSDI